MKKLSVLTFFLYCAIASFSQGFPNNQSISNPITLYHAKGGITGDVGFVNTRYTDTAAANLTYIAHQPGGQIIVGNTVYVRDTTTVKWIEIGSSGTVIVGGDTTYVQLPLYVDTLGGIRTLKIFHPDGYEGGVVTYAGTGFDFNVSPITLYLRNKVFLFPATTLTLSAPNSEPRYDIFGVDSLGAFVKSGDTAAVPVEPQVGIDSFALTKAFLISPGDTNITTVSNRMIYDETSLSPEWPISTVGFIELDSLNTDNPYSLTHDIFISKYSSISNTNPVITFQHATVDTFHRGDVLQFALYLNDTLENTSVYFDLLKNGAYATNYLILNNGYINPNDINRYVLVTIPLDNLTWLSNGTYDAMRIGFIGTDSSGASGLYLDKIFIQSGIQNIPSSIDYSNKQDSNYVRNDSLFWVAKGVEHFVGKIGGGTTDTTSLSDRIDLKLNTSDTASMLSPYLRKNAIAEGTNISFTGTGTDADPIVINASGGGGSGVDSSAIHVGYITIPGDTSIVFSDLKGNSDTVNISLLQLWKRNGSKIYYSGGNVGIGVDTPAYNFHILQPSVDAGDNSGIYLQNTNTGSGGKVSPPLILGAVNNNSGTLSYKDFIIQAETPGSPSLSNLRIYARTNYGSYASPILTLGDNGSLTLGGVITQNSGGGNNFAASVSTSATFFSTLSTAAGQTRYNYRATGTASTTNSGTLYNFSSESNSPVGATVLIPFSNLYGTNLFNQNGGKTGIGVTAINNSAKVEIADTASGVLLPRMTKAQRDRIISSITGSITSGGTGYNTSTGTFISLTGGSGYNATALITISGGAVTGVTIINPGSGYVVGDVLSESSITGTGFTYTISAIGAPAEGLQIYQTDNTPGPRYYIGGTWYKTSLTAD